MKTISLKLLVLIMLIVLAVISIWLERKDDTGTVSDVIGDPAVAVAHTEDMVELWHGSLTSLNIPDDFYL